MPASRPATASRCWRPIHPTSSRPPTPAGRSAPWPSSSTGASDSRGCAVRCGAPSHGGSSAPRKTLGAARALRWAPDARPLELASLSGSGAKLSDVVERHAAGRRRARRGRLHLGRDRPGEGRPLRPADDGGAVHRRARVLCDRRRRSSRGRVRAVRALRAGARDPGRRAGLRHHEARVTPGRGARRCLRRRRGDDRLRRAGGTRRRSGLAGDAHRRGEGGARRAPPRPLGRRTGAAARRSRRSASSLRRPSSTRPTA